MLRKRTRGTPPMVVGRRVATRSTRSDVLGVGAVAKGGGAVRPACITRPTRGKGQPKVITGDREACALVPRAPRWVRRIAVQDGLASAEV